MTLRDYFAGQALKAAVRYHGTHDEERRERCATEAYQVADAMLKHREWVEGTEEKL